MLNASVENLGHENLKKKLFLLEHSIVINNFSRKFLFICGAQIFWFTRMKIFWETKRESLNNSGHFFGKDKKLIQVQTAKTMDDSSKKKYGEGKGKNVPKTNFFFLNLLDVAIWNCSELFAAFISKTSSKVFKIEHFGSLLALSRH